MPKYVTESGYEESEEVRTRVGRNPPPPQTLWLVDLAERRPRRLDPGGAAGHPRGSAGLPRSRGQGRVRRATAAARGGGASGRLPEPRPLSLLAAAWNGAGDRLAVMLRSIDNKDRWLAEVDLGEARLLPRHRLHDPAWINWAFNDFGWMPDGRTLWFLSEESGYSHFYTLPPGATAARQHTRGEFEVWQPTVARDGRRVWLLANHGDPTRAGVYLLDLERDSLTEVGAHDWVEDYVIAPDEQRMLLAWSASHLPRQLTVMPATGGIGRVLTDTRSEAYRAIAWIGPEFVAIPSRHGAPRPILGKLYRPPAIVPGRRYPLVFFAHGAGYLQNVHRGFPHYFREQMFHDLLARRGFFVLDLDFRASRGYGRDWRTAIYRRMGTPELEDHLDALAWIAEREPIDRERVGIYGGSYGGFLALMAMFRHPEVFKAGAALRPVTDWAAYNHPYTSNILNTPQRDPEAYRISSPIEYAEGLRGHLLISHGMLDDNVLYQDAVRLAQRLIELRKPNWELASYPLERHAFRHPESWYDQYRRVLALFERVLLEAGEDG
ncbi:MAG: alpha/beta fold hydrolase [Xanthomonadales bacterium]|nr:alpha/beta fold hydrolase [Xanthomonadales bacterium]